MALSRPLECLLLTFFLIVYFPANYAQTEDTTRPEVTITQGTLQGITMTTRKNRSFSAFLGIPYAQPPIGNLRFANPVPASDWDGILDASDNETQCPQYSMGSTTSNVMVGDEDCLLINVYTPRLPQTADASLLPVMVFIHGGGFVFGSAIPDQVGSNYLLDEDVVFAAMNYRLGALGFLSTGDAVASGNWGLKDQVLALEWIRDNIKFFGGDPDQVTLFGESAGAASVHLLALADATTGLFHRYILQSGSVLGNRGFPPRADYSKVAFEFGVSVGCSNDTSESLISCLRTVDPPTVLAASMSWSPTDEPEIEGALLTDSPSNLLAAGKIHDLPSISGICRDEGVGFISQFYENEELVYSTLADVDSYLANLAGITNPSDSQIAWINAAKSYYFNDMTASVSELLANLTAITSDNSFYYPARNALERQYALTKSPQYFYTMNYAGTYSHGNLNSGSTDNYGVSHADDLLYLFPPDSRFEIFNKSRSVTDYEMVDRMVQLWTSFAITGTPTASAMNGTIWEPYTPADDAYLRIGNNSDLTLEVQYSFFEERMQLWASLYALSDDSDAVSWSPNFIFLLLVAYSKLVLS